MRLLERVSPSDGHSKPQFKLTKWFKDSEIPQFYAILSHRWEDEEVLLEDIETGAAASKKGYKKLEFCADQVAKDGILYFWVDTCCINKNSDAELSESINSMFKWYKRSTKCYVFLSDVSAPKTHPGKANEKETPWRDAFRTSLWFTRGWTLQELIAPTSVTFYSAEGRCLGKREEFTDEIAEITVLPAGLLRGTPLSRFSIEERLQWAAHRHTTIEEDAVYCLLGLVDVHMPLIYSEGKAKAMRRLRREIQLSGDPSVVSENPSGQATAAGREPGPDSSHVSMQSKSNHVVENSTDDREDANIPADIRVCFSETLTRFQSSITSEQRASYQRTSIRDAQANLKRMQKQQAAKYKSMNLARLTGLLNGMQMLDKLLEFPEKDVFIGTVMGIMKSCLWSVVALYDVFDALIKIYKSIGDAFQFSDHATTWLSANPQRHEILCKVCQIILSIQRLVLQAMTFPPVLLRTVFKSIWQDTLPRFSKEIDCLNSCRTRVNDMGREVGEQQHGTQIFSVHEDRPARMARLKSKWTELQQWLAASPSSDHHKSACEVRAETPGSGSWLLAHPSYVSWRLDDVPQPPILWVNGIVGAGKTILASAMIEDCVKGQNSATAFFYCHYDDSRRNTALSVLNSLLSQLVTEDHALLPWFYDQYVGSHQLSLIDERMSTDMLKAILLSNTRSIIVIDGLDECEVKDRRMIITVLTTILSEIESVEPGKLRVAFVSRNENDIGRALKTHSEIMVMPSNIEADMKNFINIWCRKVHEKFEELDKAEVEYISESTLHFAKGMFLFAKLVLTNLYAQPSLQLLREQTLRANFPDGLDAAYDRIIKRICITVDGTQMNLAKLILGWMMFAKRPLKWREIQGALSINGADRTIDFVQRRSRTHIRDICGSLVSSFSGDRLELVHISAKSYLLRSNFIQDKEAESNLATLCLNYLTFDCFEDECSTAQLSDFLTRGHFIFQDYAAAHWPDHIMSVLTRSSNKASGVTDGFRSALADFVYHYGLAEAPTCDVDEASTSESQYQNDVHSISKVIQAQKAKGQPAFDEVIPPLLDRSIRRNRQVLENYAQQPNLEANITNILQQAYGRKWLKCTKAACFYFHEGFSEAKMRRSHIERHEQPFRCPFPDCEDGYKLGFTTETLRDKHMAIHHPEHAVVRNTFARLKKSSQKPIPAVERPSLGQSQGTRHCCHLCSNSYSRKEKLNIHLRTHDGAREQFFCSVEDCRQPFLGEHARNRHEKEVHRGEGKFRCAYKLQRPGPFPQVFGCRKEFTRLKALENHWRSKAGVLCLKPVQDQEDHDRQMQDRIARRKAEGWELHLPPGVQPCSLEDIFPDLVDTTTGDSSMSNPLFQRINLDLTDGELEQHSQSSLTTETAGQSRVSTPLASFSR